MDPALVQQAGSSLVKDTALGAFAIICLSLAVWAITQLKKVQDDRVADKEKAADRLEASNERDRLALGELTKAVSQAVTVQQDTVKAIDRNTKALEELSKAMDGVIRDAVGLRRRTGISSATFTAVRDPGTPSP